MIGCYRIALIPGDGIGPEITDASLDVLAAVQKKSNLRLEIEQTVAGDECLKRKGVALPIGTINTIKKFTFMPERTCRRNSCRRHCKT